MENSPPSLLHRSFNVAWIGLALAIVATAGMVMAYLAAASAGSADPNSHSQRELAAYGKAIIVVYMGYPFLGFAVIAFAVGLGCFVVRLMQHRNVAASVITMLLCGLSFFLFAAMWVG